MSGLTSLLRLYLKKAGLVSRKNELKFIFTPRCVGPCLKFHLTLKEIDYVTWIDPACTNALWVIGRDRDLCYKDRLIKLNLLPLIYWLEYLDLVFFYKPLRGDVIFARHFDEYFSFLRGCTRRANSEFYLKVPMK